MAVDEVLPPLWRLAEGLAGGAGPYHHWRQWVLRLDEEPRVGLQPAANRENPNGGHHTARRLPAPNMPFHNLLLAWQLGSDTDHG